MKLEDHARSSVARRLIQRYTTPIALERSEIVSDGAGGRRANPLVTLPVRNRYFGPVTAPALLGIDEQGRRLEERHVLLSVAGDDIRAGDRFTVGTKRYVVEHVVSDGPEVVARVLRVTGG